MVRNLMFPSLYYFSLECCSAACLIVVMKAPSGQKRCELQNAPDHKQASTHSPHLSLPFGVADVGVWYLWHLQRALKSLERWRLIDELRESSNMAQLPVSECCQCQTEESVCLSVPPPALQVHILAECISRAVDVSQCCTQERNNLKVGVTWGQTIQLQSQLHLTFHTILLTLLKIIWNSNFPHILDVLLYKERAEILVLYHLNTSI